MMTSNCRSYLTGYRPRPQEITAINPIDKLFDDTDDEKGLLSHHSIRILKSVLEYGGMDIGISDTVARLALSKVQHRLPQWATIEKKEIEESTEFNAG